MWYCRSCTVIGIMVFAGLLLNPDFMCSMWTNVAIGLGVGVLGFYMLKNNMQNGWIILAAAALIFLTNYPAFTRCEMCCYVSKIIFSLLLIFGGQKKAFKLLSTIYTK